MYLALAETLKGCDERQLHSLIRNPRVKIARALEIMSRDPDRDDYVAKLTIWRAMIYASSASDKTLS